jgi:hypothetical protein
LSKRPTVESLQRNGDYLDPVELRRLQLLTTNRRVTAEACWRWRTIQTLVCEPQCLIVQFRNTSQVGYYQIAWMPVCGRGGITRWIVCPDCNTRRARLYKALGGYSCAACIGAKYTSHQIANEKRRKLKRKALLAVLNVHHDLGGIVRKPRGMWRRRFRRIRNAIEHAEAQLGARFRRTHTRLQWRIGPGFR